MSETSNDAPTFIIKVGDVYHVTSSAWTYDASKAQTDEHRTGCEEVAKQFRLSEPVEARVAKTFRSYGGSQTD